MYEIFYIILHVISGILFLIVLYQLKKLNEAFDEYINKLYDKLKPKP